MKYLTTYNKLFESSDIVSYLKDIFLYLVDSSFEVKISDDNGTTAMSGHNLYYIDIQRGTTFKLSDVYNEISSSINYMITNGCKLHSFVAKCSDYESDIKSLKEDGEIFKQDFTDLFEGLIQNEYTGNDILEEYDDLYFIRIIMVFKK